MSVIASAGHPELAGLAAGASYDQAVGILPHSLDTRTSALQRPRQLFRCPSLELGLNATRFNERPWTTAFRHQNLSRQN